MGDTENLHIGIIGLIGAGKTTLCQKLADELGLPAFFEPVAQNPYLEAFYEDMAKHSFAMQVYLLNERFRQHQHIIWQNKGGVQDRTIYEDSIFAGMLTASGLMDPRDYQTYLALFANMSRFMRHPNVIVMLDVAPEVSLARIRERGRECEKGITLEYLQKLHAGYEAFVRDISRSIPVIRVDWNTFMDEGEMARHIVEEYRTIQTVHVLKRE
jgi:deoxyadenosine kinase